MFFLSEEGRCKMNYRRWPSLIAVLLRNGMVLVVGGVDNCCPGLALASAEIYDPSTGETNRSDFYAADESSSVSALTSWKGISLAGSRPAGIRGSCL